MHMRVCSFRSFGLDFGGKSYEVHSVILEFICRFWNSKFSLYKAERTRNLKLELFYNIQIFHT